MKHLNESWEQWKDENGIFHSKPTKRSEIYEKYMERAAELAKQGDANVRRAVTAIAEHYFSIWD